MAKLISVLVVVLMLSVSTLLGNYKGEGQKASPETSKTKRKVAKKKKAPRAEEPLPELNASPSPEELAPEAPQPMQDPPPIE